MKRSNPFNIPEDEWELCEVCETLAPTVHDCVRLSIGGKLVESCDECCEEDSKRVLKPAFKKPWPRG